MKLKRVVFWSHLVVGVATGLVVVLLAGTGVLLTYERQITAWAQDGAVAPAAGRPPLDADAAVAAALRAGARPGNRVTLDRDPARAVEVAAGRRARFVLDPYTGDVLNEAAATTKTFFRAVTELHRWLALPGQARETGAAITGAANLAFLFLLLSGVYLWWPPAWKWPVLRHKVLTCRAYPSARARDYNWHHVLAAWALVPLAAIVVSGVVISYPWASDLVYRAFGETRQGGDGAGRSAGQGQGQGRGAGVRDTGAASAGSAARTRGAAGTRADGDTPTAAYATRVVAAARAAVPDHRTISVVLPGGAVTRVEVQVDRGNGAQFTRRTTLWIAPADGRVLERRDNADASAATRARAFLRFLHTGEVYGLVGQTLAGLASLAAMLLVYTGLALAWRRLVSPRLARSRRPRGAGQSDGRGE